MSFREITVAEAAERIKEAKNLLVIGHTNADGDALGSVSALALIAEALGARVRCVTPEKPAERLKSLVPWEWRELKREELGEYDTVCAVDVASPVQLGCLSYLADEGKVSFMIDHHAAGTPFAPCLVDGTASAAGEIVFTIYAYARANFGLPPLPDAARGLYAAIISDTGTFRYSNTTPETHRIAAELVGEINSSDGVKTDAICYELFGKQSLTDLRATALSMKKLCFFADGAIGAVMLTRDELDAEGLDDGDVSGAVEVPRSIDGVKIALAIRQTADDREYFKISSRSNCEANVAEVCSALGGGGHAKAAGCGIRAESPEKALLLAAAEFEKALG
ncbi:MAG: DHH family phosphoesterase [Clostridia bacterium]|nr:DHH family phosphoesterase [Clostridia bacterium]